ncbi:MAG: BatD family protein [Methylobacter sp.]|nr:BatD family protein [Methylobacter sp.]MDP2427050.1 BatD family protein [Methylobacter sp.]MDP3053028.1 BatD family protein [Methylobacter sp.]MDP3362897.1 BatD family protein [Methylobacter sp.]MDZ4218744.1 BatD family protein [Methylobacter sp.]
MNTLKKLFYVLLLLNLASAQVLAAEISVSLDRNPVSLDESFQIIFTANDTPDGDPDFSPLEQDFELLNQSQSSNMSLINGQLSKSMKWTLNVMAKHPGSLVVPAVRFGADSSQAVSILVPQNADNKSVDSKDDLFLEVQVSPESPYVQSQVLYTARLYRRIDITRAGLSEPELSDAVVEKLGDDSNYNTQINGVNYAVTERKYAIFPQKSGSLTIKPLELTAEVPLNNRPSFGGFFNPQMTKAKKVLSKALTLDVKPVPASFTGQHWLSAEQLELKEQWSGDTQQMKVGEPLTRTLTLLAKGTTVSQLPDLNSGTVDGQLKTYPDQPALQEQKKADGLVAFREEKIAIIPSTAGFYKLPAIEIPWFNSQSQTMEIAKIPETMITVADAAGTLPEPAIPAVQAHKVDVAPLAQPTQQNIWLWISAFLAVGWFATYIRLLILYPPKKPVTAKSEREISLQDCVKKLKKACADNNATAAKEALLAWGRQKYSTHEGISVANLGVIAELSEARLRDEILHLNHVLYGKTTEQWQGKKLFQAFAENKARKKISDGDGDQLEPLYRL